MATLGVLLLGVFWFVLADLQPAAQNVATRLAPLGFDVEEVRLLKSACNRFRTVQPKTIVQASHRIRINSKSFNDKIGDIALKNIIDFDVRRDTISNLPLFERFPGGDILSKRQISNELVGERHPDQILASLAEAMTPKEQIIRDSFGVFTVEKLLTSSRNRFILSQELEWSFLAYLLYLPDCPVWQNRFGERISYEDICKRLLESQMGSGGCTGTHRLFVLTKALYINNRYNFLSAKMIKRIHKRLNEAVSQLAQTQLQAGGWDEHWASMPAAQSRVIRIKELIYYTGHHLEWLILARSGFITY
ncbi:hypothetical protein [Gimesia panareensis]|uniref:hypothetical protein n=1 Tax=Gimesia panareensis TaxID=2527978 RepID=UPI0011A31A0A|nr:hypothetical protein [Gimesia panareensis]